MPRTLDIAVAVVYEPSHGFLLSFNARWKGYSFPMRQRRATDADLASGALLALREAVSHPLPRAQATPLVFVETEGTSQGTGEETIYRYHAFDIDPVADLYREAAPHGFGCRNGFLPLKAITPVIPGTSPELATLPADLVTWSTRRIVEELLGNQEVGVAVIRRQTPGGMEYLMRRYPGYGGYFFIAARRRQEANVKFEVRQAIQTDLGYLSRVTLGDPVLVTEIQPSPRFESERRFVFHLFDVSLPGVDLLADDSALTQAIEKSGRMWRWVHESEMDSPLDHGLSPTVEALRQGVRGW